MENRQRREIKTCRRSYGFYCYLKVKGWNAGGHQHKRFVHRDRSLQKNHSDGLILENAAAELSGLEFYVATKLLDNLGQITLISSSAKWAYLSAVE